MATEIGQKGFLTFEKQAPDPLPIPVTSILLHFALSSV